MSAKCSEVNGFHWGPMDCSSPEVLNIDIQKGYKFPGTQEIDIDFTVKSGVYGRSFHILNVEIDGCSIKTEVKGVEGKNAVFSQKSVNPAVCYGGSKIDHRESSVVSIFTLKENLLSIVIENNENLQGQIRSYLLEFIVKKSK
jgi:hypothetical protein